MVSDGVRGHRPLPWRAPAWVPTFRHCVFSLGPRRTARLRGTSEGGPLCRRAVFLWAWPWFAAGFREHPLCLRGVTIIPAWWGVGSGVRIFKDLEPSLA